MKPTTHQYFGPVPLIAQAKPIATAVHKRPIRTYYYDSVTASDDEWARRSRASTLHNAIIAALRHILSKEVARADFYDEDGSRIGWVHRTTKNNINVFHTNFKQMH